jgi:hypothetical protein
LLRAVLAAYVRRREEFELVADLVVAELVVAALHEVAAGADARLEVSGSWW